MTKERLNVTVDPDVKQQLQRRSDINVSGAVNEFLKRRLSGEHKDDAQLRIEIQRHEDTAESFREQARKEEQKAEEKRQELAERKQERQAALREVLEKIEVTELHTGTVVDTDEDRLEQLSEQVDLSMDELRQEAIAYYTDGEDCD